MNLPSELKTLLALAGNKRLPHLEEEIFADSELTSIYLRHLCPQWRPYGYNNATLAVYYAVFILQAPWPAAEPLIKSLLDTSAYYNEHIVNRT